MLYQDGHNILMQPSITMKLCQNVSDMYLLKVKKFKECTCMRPYSVKQNMKDDANLHLPGKGLSYSSISCICIVQ